jgi:hypothetical protein
MHKLNNRHHHSAFETISIPNLPSYRLKEQQLKTNWELWESNNSTWEDLHQRQKNFDSNFLLRLLTSLAHLPLSIFFFFSSLPTLSLVDYLKALLTMTRSPLCFFSWLQEISSMPSHDAHQLISQ